MDDIKDIDDYLKKAQEEPLFPGKLFREQTEEDRHKENIELQNKHHKENLREQKKLVKSTIITTVITLFLVLGTLMFGGFENNREQNQFELNMRPYLIIDKIETQILNEKEGKVKYTFVIKNSGVLPAKIINRNISINEPNKIESSPLVDDKKEKTFGTLIAPQGTIDYAVTFQFSSTEELPIDLIPQLNLFLNYTVALEEFKEKNYITNELYWLAWAKRPEIIGGYMV